MVWTPRSSMLLATLCWTSSARGYKFAPERCPSSLCLWKVPLSGIFDTVPNQCSAWSWTGLLEKSGDLPFHCFGATCLQLKGTSTSKCSTTCCWGFAAVQTWCTNLSACRLPYTVNDVFAIHLCQYTSLSHQRQHIWIIVRMTLAFLMLIFDRKKDR